MRMKFEKTKDTPAKSSLCKGARTANYMGCPAKLQYNHININKNCNSNYQ